MCSMSESKSGQLGVGARDSRLPLGKLAVTCSQDVQKLHPCVEPQGPVAPCSFEAADGVAEWRQATVVELIENAGEWWWIFQAPSPSLRSCICSFTIRYGQVSLATRGPGLGDKLF